MPFEAAETPRFAPLPTRIARWLLALALIAACLYFFAKSVHWPLLEDSPIMHYVIFLTRHGFQPYQTITDNNLPGAYLTEGFAMRLFGTGDVAWRLYEFFLLTLLTLTCVAIARRKDWFAGLFGGAMFLLVHAADGPNYAVERDEVITLLALLACWCAFASVRRLRPWLFFPFGFAIGMATSIKPTALPLGIALLAIAAYVLWKRSVRPTRYIAFALGGFALAAALNLAFLAQHHAFAAFWFVLHGITPHYVALAHPSFPNMLRNLMPRSLRNFVVLLGIPLFVLNRGVRHWDWERYALAACAAFGLVSFFVQQKGFVQHRYMFEAFLLLLLGFELTQALRTPAWPRRLALLGTAATLLYMIPTCVKTIRSFRNDDPLTASLTQDLTSLGGDKLQRQVFCFDLVYGCINSLYHLGLVENTGYTGDLLLFFPDEGGLATRYYRDMFWRLQSEHPANVLVVTNQWLQRPIPTPK